MHDAKIDVVIYPLLESAESVLRRQNLNTDERSGADNFIPGIVFSNNAQVGDSKSRVRNLDPLFGQGKHVPGIPILVEDNYKRRLQGRMTSFTQISLLDLAVDKIAIGSEARAQIFVQGNERSLRHTFIL